MTCALCSLPSSEGSNLCHWCGRKEAKDKKKLEPIAKKSAKQKDKDKIYNKNIKVIKSERPYCELKLPGCQGWTKDNHHLFSGADRAGHELDKNESKTACRSCHDKAHEMSSEDAVKTGLRKKEKYHSKYSPERLAIQ